MSSGSERDALYQVCRIHSDVREGDHEVRFPTLPFRSFIRSSVADSQAAPSTQTPHNAEAGLMQAIIGGFSLYRTVWMVRVADVLAEL